MVVKTHTGILLVNTGTPDAPTKEAVVRYLRLFLMDRRIVNIPPLIWKPILNGIILKVRPKKTVGIYERIWTDAGSPYTLFSNALEQKLSDALSADDSDTLEVRVVHRYGNPSIQTGLRNMQQRGIEHLIILPLYPQQAHATTGTVRDEFERQLSALNYAPQLIFVDDYYRQSEWIDAVADSIRPHLAERPKTHLLFSFHSEPLKDLRHGDPYRQQVEASVTSVAGKLGLSSERYSLAYQSRFDDAQRWLGPFLPKVFESLIARGEHDIGIVCPGFAVDCTETLYDIDIKLRTEFKYLASDPEESFTYIPCLNDTDAHVKALQAVIKAAQ